MTLDDIAIKYGTDKATFHNVRGHGYTPHYERFFAPWRNESIKLLEIGVGSGESIQTWLEYFSHASVYGVDIVRDTNSFNTVTLGQGRYAFSSGDQANPVFWSGFLEIHGRDWDVIIDDGGHFANQVIESFNSLWPAVKSGGVYCIEDLGVAYGEGTIFVPDGCKSHRDFLKDKLDEINSDPNSNIESLTLSRELAIFRKR